MELKTTEKVPFVMKKKTKNFLSEIQIENQQREKKENKEKKSFKKKSGSRKGK